MGRHFTTAAQTFHKTLDGRHFASGIQDTQRYHEAQQRVYRGSTSMEEGIYQSGPQLIHNPKKITDQAYFTTDASLKAVAVTCPTTNTYFAEEVPLIKKHSSIAVLELVARLVSSELNLPSDWHRSLHNLNGECFNPRRHRQHQRNGVVQERRNSIRL